MTKIEVTTQIKAPRQVCFDLSLSIDIELQAASTQQIKAIAGVTSGVMRGGDTVTWKARQFGVWLTHTTVISGYDPPSFFQDSMLDGVFDYFAHDHFFTNIASDRTEMRDELSFGMPLLMLGRISEQLLVKRRLMRMLQNRNQIIKKLAEDSAP